MRLSLGLFQPIAADVAVIVADVAVAAPQNGIIEIAGKGGPVREGRLGSHRVLRRILPGQAALQRKRSRCPRGLLSAPGDFDVDPDKPVDPTKPAVELEGIATAWVWGFGVVQEIKRTSSSAAMSRRIRREEGVRRRLE